MEAEHRPHRATAVHELDRALAELMAPAELRSRRVFAACLSIESARDLLCDEREPRALLLLQHARKMVDALAGATTGGPERGVAVAARYLDNALMSLGTAPN
jgi:hypothetical protein